ncbi:MAG: hypothetical protein QXT25_03215 [Candidatus Anstonellaceae archaeon]
MFAELKKEDAFANAIINLANQKLGLPYGKDGYNCVTLVFSVLREVAKNEGKEFRAPWFVNGGTLVKTLTEPAPIYLPSQLKTQKGDMLMRVTEAKSFREIMQHYKAGDMALRIIDGKVHAITQEEAKNMFLRGEKVYLVKHYLISTGDAVIHASSSKNKVVKEKLERYLEKNRRSSFVVINLHETYMLGASTVAKAQPGFLE